MRKILILLGTASILAAGCSTTKPILFIATPGYVDQEIAAVRNEVERAVAENESEAAIVSEEVEVIREEIAAVSEELERQREVAAELAALAEDLAGLQASTAELEALAAQVEGRLGSLPLETLQLLRDVLAEYLAGRDLE